MASRAFGALAARATALPVMSQGVASGVASAGAPDGDPEEAQAAVVGSTWNSSRFGPDVDVTMHYRRPPGGSWHAELGGSSADGSVEAPILDRLGKVGGGDLLLPREVRDGAGDTQYAGVGAGREAEPVARDLEKTAARRADATEAPHLPPQLRAPVTDGRMSPFPTGVHREWRPVPQLSMGMRLGLWWSRTDRGRSHRRGRA
jgi:hypothetical protein